MTAEPTTATSPAHTGPVPPPPPFDPELAAVLELVREQIPTTFTLEQIPLLREATNPLRPSDEDLRRGSAFQIEERSVPGPEGRRTSRCSSAGRAA